MCVYVRSTKLFMLFKFIFKNQYIYTTLKKILGVSKKCIEAPSIVLLVGELCLKYNIWYKAPLLFTF